MEWWNDEDQDEDTRTQMLLTRRCAHCVTGYHERCEGFGITRCSCYCADLLEDDGSPVD